MVGIYKITSPSGRIYIGQSWNIINRFRQYKNIWHTRDQPVLNRSFEKYGIAAHDFQLVHELPEDVDQIILDTYEIIYWSSYKEAGAKMMNAKEPGRGGKHFPETIERMKGTGNHRYGKKHLEETKAIMREKAIGRKPSQKCIEAASRATKGKPHSEERREKMSEAQEGHKGWNKGQPSNVNYTPELRAKIGAAKKGKPSPLKGKRNPAISESQKNIWAIRKEKAKSDPSINIGRPHSEETKEKQREAAKRRWRQTKLATIGILLN
jgi:hypothetical protein